MKKEKFWLTLQQQQSDAQTNPSEIPQPLIDEIQKGCIHVSPSGTVIPLIGSDAEATRAYLNRKEIPIYQLIPKPLREEIGGFLARRRKKQSKQN